MKKILTLANLPKSIQKHKKRRGRGYGSGKSKTAGRGTKGQLVRGKMPMSFEGGQLSIVRRLPFLRGKSKNKSLKSKPTTLPLFKLQYLKAGSSVTLSQLQKDGIIDPNVLSVKVVSKGDYNQKLTVFLPCSQGAKARIIKAGGSVLADHE
ncbi:50S ribosomal protein L15 [Candidatus Gottesmanbacteria bacterium RBG_16_43_7]|uniref:Large ribosomal subunit protein uL15 n=1 Tax=Candidatus Gottesmanbacteria bacterium RBG_16_43_7 TaxID=1798373 RepID=A0A1F5ZA22_9BACT|nr:MAG: 50S ribosomal protein L15 [Candidatus Gottesmanbacteria bacterium RBG_16_43_7]